MEGRNFRNMLESRWADNTFVCVGLDSDFARIPETAYRGGRENGVSIQDTIVEFNRAIVDATHDLVCAYKPNIAFYAARGDNGLKALQRTITVIHRIAPNVPVILDAKRADIGNTNAGYVQEALDYLQADAARLATLELRELINQYRNTELVSKS